jgi:ABC-type lipoprotein export system ATPase subunit
VETFKWYVQKIYINTTNYICFRSWFAYSKGEIVSIAAGNTLLQILGTLDKPSPENEIMLRINDQDILTMNDKNLSKFRNKLGFIFQFHQLLPEFTALEMFVFLLLLRINLSMKQKSRRKIIGLSWAPTEWITNPMNYLEENNNGSL